MKALILAIVLAVSGDVGLNNSQGTHRVILGCAAFLAGIGSSFRDSVWSR